MRPPPLFWLCYSAGFDWLVYNHAFARWVSPRCEGLRS